MAPSELDFGIMCRGTEFEDWQAECIRKLRNVDGVNLELLVMDAGDSSGGLRAKAEKLLDYRRRTNTGAAINRAAWFLYGLPFDDPPCKATTDLSDELASVDRVHCDVIEEGFSQYFRQEDVAAIREYDLDFVLRFAFGILRGEILEVPRYGVWSFHHDDERKYRGTPPCFWEIYNGDPVTGAVLQRLTDRLDGGTILKRGFFPTRRSYGRNVDNVFRGTTEWPAQVAIDILNGNGEYVDGSPTESNAPIYRPPSPVQLLEYNVKRGASLAKTVLDGLGHWNVGVLREPIEASIDGASTPAVDWFPRPREEGFIADPFPIEIDGTTYVFVEDLSYSDWKGKISYVEYPDGFERGVLETAHEEPYHMSYPYLFEHEGDVYATPEIHESGEIRLYRVHSPSEWEERATLVSGVAGLDPTVFEYDDRWWMYYTKPEYANSKLYVRYADDLFGDWNPHENNPVKTDVRSARPGGTPFVEEGNLYRPAQYCAGGYGGRVVVNEVETLTPTAYEERVVGELNPAADGPYPAGMHTLSSQGGITVVDGKRLLRNGYAFRHQAELALSLLSKRFG